MDIIHKDLDNVSIEQDDRRKAAARMRYLYVDKWNKEWTSADLPFNIKLLYPKIVGKIR